MTYYTLVGVILLAISAVLTLIGRRSRAHMAIVAVACMGLLILVDFVDQGRVGPLAWEWVLMAVAIPLFSAMAIVVLAATKAARWIQILAGAVAGFVAVVVVGTLVNFARGR